METIPTLSHVPQEQELGEVLRQCLDILADIDGEFQKPRTSVQKLVIDHKH